MGRPAMSPETIANNRKIIVSAAMEMIREGGIQSVSARSLGARVEMNSALIYRYFKDIEEIILYACIHVLQEYTREMSDATRKAAETGEISSKELYILSWEIFSRHAFEHAEEYRTLFFSKYNTSLHKILSDYHELFPRESRDDDNITLEGMYRTPDIRDRNLMVLIPVLEGIKSEQDILLINDMTVSFFFYLLGQLTDNIQNEGLTPDLQERRMLKACIYLIET